MPDAPPPEESEPEPEASAEDAARELALALPAVADLARTGMVSPNVVEQLREAACRFLADDGRPKAPLDVEAERVEQVPAAQSERVVLPN